MKAPPLLVILLLAAIVLVDLSVRLMESGWSDPAFILLLSALIVSQAALLGFWLGMGKGSVLVRFIGVCAGVVLLGSLFSDPPWVPNPSALPNLFVFSFIQAVVFFGLRIAGFCIERSDTFHRPVDCPAYKFRVRYSIWNIIEWTTCVAVFLALSRNLNFVWSNLFWSQSVNAAIVFSVISVIAFSSAWETLRAGRMWPWLVVIGGSMLLLGVLLGFDWFGFILLVLYAMLATGMFLVLRVGGYRIVRRGPATDDSDTGNENGLEVAE